MDDKLKEKIALFRFSLIAPMLNNTFTEPTVKAYLETICAKVYDVPHFGKREYAPSTIKGWYLAYRKYGIEGLYPSQRSDKGKSRSLSETVKQYIIDAKALHPERSAKSIYHELIARGIIASGDVSLSTVAQPFSPQSKGKIERWFQTLQNQWLNLLDWSSISSIEQLNKLLYDYVENHYHQTVHSAINAKPIDKYTQHIDRIRFVSSKQELDFIFLYRVTRKVKNDATITILNALFEVPFKYIGEQIKLRYDPTQLDKAYIFDDNGKCVETVYPVSKIDNSKVIRAKHKNPVDFSPFNV